MSVDRAPLMSHEDRVALITRPFGITTRVAPHVWAGCFIPDEAPSEEPAFPTRYRVRTRCADVDAFYDHPDRIYTEDEENLL